MILFHRQFVPIGTILFTDELQRSGAALGRIVGLIRSAGADTPQPIDDYSSHRQSPAVEVKGLNYRYEDGPEILHDLAFHILRGARYAWSADRELASPRLRKLSLEPSRWQSRV